MDSANTVNRMTLTWYQDPVHITSNYSGDTYGM